MATSLDKLSDAMRQTSEHFPNKYNSNTELNNIPTVLQLYLKLNPQTYRISRQRKKNKWFTSKMHAR